MSESGTAEFSIQDVAFTGFGVVRHHPKALLALWLYALVLSLVLGAVSVSLAGPDLSKFMALAARQPTDPTLFSAWIGRLAPAYAACMVVIVAADAVLAAAMIRSVLRPQDDRFGYLRLGADELRQLGLAVLSLLVFFGAYIGVVLVCVIIGVLLTFLNATTGAMLFVMLVLSAGIMVFLAVRFSLAPTLTFDSRRINLFGSWALTRGRFWPLFGAYSLTLALVLVVYLLSFLLIFAVEAVLNGGDPTAAMFGPEDSSSLKTYFSSARLVETALGAGVSALIWPVLLTPQAAIYRALSPTSGMGEAFA